MASNNFRLSRRSNSSPQLQCEATDFSSLTGVTGSGSSSGTAGRATGTTSSWSEPNASGGRVDNVVKPDVQKGTVTTASVHWLEPKQRAVHNDEPVLVVKPKATMATHDSSSGRSQSGLDPDMLRCNETIHYLQGSDSDSSSASTPRRKAYGYRRKHSENRSDSSTFKRFSKVASQLLAKLKMQDSRVKTSRELNEVKSDSDTQVEHSPVRQSQSLTSRMFKRFSRKEDNDAESSGSDEADRVSPSTTRKAKHRAKRRSKSDRACKGASKRAAKQAPLVNFAKFDPEKYPIDCTEDIERAARELEIEEGIDAASATTQGSTPTSPCRAAASELSHQNVLADRSDDAVSVGIPPGALIANDTQSEEAVDDNAPSHTTENIYDLYGSLTPSGTFIPRTVHTQIDYMHCLVPDQWNIMKSSYYWGKIDRYEADNLLENKPEGTFLLRDSAQEEFLFSVSFCRYGRTLHARIEQWNHKFSFDAHDPGVYSSDTVCGLLEHYKDPNYCMFFEPMLTNPLPRVNPPSLQDLARARICSHLSYDSICYLELPNSLKEFLRDYHYKQRIRIRRVEVDMPQLPKGEPSVVTNTCISR